MHVVDCQNGINSSCFSFASHFVASYYFLILIKKFINLLLVALTVCWHTRALSSCGEWGLLFVAAHGLLDAAASLVGKRPGNVRCSVVVVCWL